MSDVIDHFIVMALEHVENTKINGPDGHTVMVAKTTDQPNMNHSSVYNII